MRNLLVVLFLLVSAGLLARAPFIPEVHQRFLDLEIDSTVEKAKVSALQSSLSTAESDIGTAETDIIALETAIGLRDEVSQVFSITFPATGAATATSYIIPANSVITDVGAILETSTTTESALTVDCVTGSSTALINAQNISAKSIGDTITGYTDGSSAKWITTGSTAQCVLDIHTPNDTDATSQLSMFVRYFTRDN